MLAFRVVLARSLPALASLALLACSSETTSGGFGESEDTCGNFCDAPSAVTQIAAGESYMCALLNSGGVTCWGFGTFGELGYGDPALQVVGDDEPPNAVGRFRLGEQASLIRTGAYHTCAITASGVRCWRYLSTTLRHGDN